ncbi:hypothetical protein C2G38_2196894 [Gigaspora rosea]|uniref:Uncharacterized protein n=1 Tax=Gigaspora rosea TaxID=44941 RepID=A0A397V3A2_9GLOM|nr:hypothetical protein C2G38_2196894 [Gigaspora rosea]
MEQQEKKKKETGTRKRKATKTAKEAKNGKIIQRPTDKKSAETQLTTKNSESIHQKMMNLLKEPTENRQRTLNESTENR